MQKLNIRRRTHTLEFSKPLGTKFRETLALFASVLAGPPMSERARIQYAITEARVRKDKAVAAAWAQYPVQGGL